MIFVKIYKIMNYGHGEKDKYTYKYINTSYEIFLEALKNKYPTVHSTGEKDDFVYCIANTAKIFITIHRINPNVFDTIDDTIAIIDSFEKEARKDSRGRS